MRALITIWMKGCVNCVAYDVWRTRKSDIHFSWSVITPFYIMYVDLWIPGKLVTSKVKYVYLMNAMCDLTQFVISSLVYNPTADNLANICIDTAVLTFGMDAVVVEDTDSKFGYLFTAMCNVLSIIV